MSLDNSFGVRLLCNETMGRNVSHDQAAATSNNANNVGQTGNVTATKQAVVKGPRHLSWRTEKTSPRQSALVGVYYFAVFL